MDEEIVFSRFNKGQVTIWIILGIVLVVSIVLFFILGRNINFVQPPEGESVFDVQAAVDSCVQKYTTEAVDLMLPQGGFVEPENAKFFDNTNIEYLCENIGYYNPCVQQHSMLLREMEQEIVSYLTPRVSGCLNEMKQGVKKRQGKIVIEPGAPRIYVNLEPDRILVRTEKQMKISMKGQTRTYDSFESIVIHPAYDLGSVAVEIAAQEAKYCNFEYVGYKIMYPRFTITKYVTSDSSNIYTIIDTKTDKKMNIAIRSCLIPAGI